MRRINRSQPRPSTARTFSGLNPRADTTGSKSQTPNPKDSSTHKYLELGIRDWSFRAQCGLASPPAALLAIAPLAGTNGILEIARIGGVDPKNRALDIVHRADVDLVSKHIAELNQANEIVQEFGLLHVDNMLGQESAVERRTGESQG